MSQSYPWFKFAHVEYLLDPMITSLSLSAQGANARLMAYAARQLPFGTLPNDNKTLLAMSGAKTAKQWQKLFAELINVVWFVNDDDRLYCPLMIVESVAQTSKQDNEQQDNEKPLSDAERAKRYRDSKKNRDENQEASHDRHDSVTQKSDTVTERHDSVTTASHDRHEENVTNRDEMGGKGGDLDLKQELNTHTLTREAEKKSPRFFDDELRPHLNLLNAKLGANLITQKFIDENLFLFNSHYETQQLTDNQRLAKWISWFKGEQAQSIKREQKTQAPKNKNLVFGNVNDSFPLNPNDRLLTAAEKAEIARMLEEDEHVVF